MCVEQINTLLKHSYLATIMKILLRNRLFNWLIIYLSLLGISCDDQDQKAPSTLLITPNRLVFSSPAAPMTYTDASVILNNNGVEPIAITQITLFEYDETKEFKIISEDFQTTPQTIDPNSSRSLAIRWSPIDELTDSGYLRIISNQGSYDIVLETNLLEAEVMNQCRTGVIEVNESLCQNISSETISSLCQDYCDLLACAALVRQQCQSLNPAMGGTEVIEVAGMDITPSGTEAGSPSMTSGDPMTGATEPPGGSGVNQGSSMCFNVNIDELESCCEEDAAHCVSSEGIPDDLDPLLGRCGADEMGVCLPDSFLTASAGFEIPSCASVGGLPGACLSVCLAGVAENRDILPQDVCNSNERCIPCINPIDGQDLGICGPINCSLLNEGDPTSDAGEEYSAGEMNNDMGGSNSEEMAGMQGSGPLGAPPCCDMQGSCLSPSIVPEEALEVLGECETSGGEQLMCVPNVMIDLSWTPEPCMGYIFIFNPYNGVCLPECLDIPLEWTFDERPCPENFVCAPCRDPSGTPTGAPGCETEP